MKIVIAGAGGVGTHLAKMLSSEKHNIVLLDQNEEHLREAGSHLDMIALHGSATSIDVLTRAEVAKADLFVSVTNSEETNITASILAKKIGARKCIARINTGEYLEEENVEFFSQLGIDYMFCPEQLAAVEIAGLISQSGTTDILNFAGGKLFLYVMRMEEDAPALNQTLNEFHNLSKDMEYKVVAIGRNDETIIPEGNEKLINKDLAFIVTTQKGINLLMKYFGKKSLDIRNIMILGGSRVGKNTAKQLARNHVIKLVERDRSKSYLLSNELQGTLVINGDGRNIDLLNQEGLSGMDAFIAVTGNSETNMLSCLVAKRLGVKKTIAEVENTEYIRLAENMGIDAIINKKLITASKIFGFTNIDEVSSVKCLTFTDAEVMEFVAKPESRITKDTIKEVCFPADAVIGGLVRGKDPIIVDENTKIKPFDKVVVFALPSAKGKVGRFFASSERFF